MIVRRSCASYWARRPMIQRCYAATTEKNTPPSLLRRSIAAPPQRRAVQWVAAAPIVPPAAGGEVTTSSAVPPSASPPVADHSMPAQSPEPLMSSFQSRYAALRAQQNQNIRQLLKERLGASFVGIAPAAHAVPSSGKLVAATSGFVNAENFAKTAGLRRVPTKLQVHRCVSAGSTLEWVDITSHPTAALEEYRDSIAAMLVDLGAHETLVEATLESVLLPQTTIIDGCKCLVVRCAVEDTSYDMDSIQELTNRLTILVFAKDKRVVTVHRTYLPQVELLQKRWLEEQGPGGAGSTLDSLMLYFIKETSRSFHKALAKSIVQFDSYEAKLFAPQKGRSSLARQIYHIKRRASVYSRILALTNDAFIHFFESMEISASNVYFQDVVQDIAHVRSLSDELNDNANSVLQLLFQLSSYQLNELMRVLTMFSAFFIPLGFIASFYGMNFEHLPGMNDPNGHWYCLAVMLVVGFSIVTWFKVKKFW